MNVVKIMTVQKDMSVIINKDVCQGQIHVILVHVVLELFAPIPMVVVPSVPVNLASFLNLIPSLVVVQNVIAKITSVEIKNVLPNLILVIQVHVDLAPNVQ